MMKERTFVETNEILPQLLMDLQAYLAGVRRTDLASVSFFKHRMDDYVLLLYDDDLYSISEEFEASFLIWNRARHTFDVADEDARKDFQDDCDWAHFIWTKRG